MGLIQDLFDFLAGKEASYTISEADDNEASHIISEADDYFTFYLYDYNRRSVGAKLRYNPNLLEEGYWVSIWLPEDMSIAILYKGGTELGRVHESVVRMLKNHKEGRKWSSFRGRILSTEPDRCVVWCDIIPKNYIAPIKVVVNVDFQKLSDNEE